MDPFLFTLQWDDWAVFDLANGLSTIAIRDQMVRAMMLADQLPAWLEQEHGDGYKRWPILVIGAGACGMTAAVALARQGLSVLVIDRKPVPFSVQRQCTSRWLDPTQYDWPMDHWPAQRFRWDPAHRQPPFHWIADRASAIVRNQWVPRLRAHRRAVGNRLRFRGEMEADLGSIQARLTPPRLLSLRLQNLRTRRWQVYGPFGAIVLAAGFAPERSSLPGSPQFAAFPFWRTDPFELVACGLPGGQAQQGTVLISGTGDGALQDFLRVVTRRRSVREIMDALGAIPLPLERIYSAEQRAERAVNWCRTRRDPFLAPYIEELHQAHVQAIQPLIGNPAVQAAIQGLIGGRPTRTVLVSTEEYFICTYALNRFLALLLLMGAPGASVQLLARHRVQQIQSNNPPANPTPQTCLGHPWQVTLTDLATNNPVNIDANVVILRHGVPPLAIAETAGQLFHGGPRPLPPTHLH